MHAKRFISRAAQSGSIVRDHAVRDGFQYWHIELDGHAILLAEATPAETLLDRVDPAVFDNAADRPYAGLLTELPDPRIKSACQRPAHLRHALAA